MSKIVIKAKEGLLLCKRGREEQGRICFVVRSPRHLVIKSTIVQRTWRGQGIAEQMTRALLEWGRGRRLVFVPQCSYTATFIDRNAEYQPYLDGYDVSFKTLEAMRAQASRERAAQTSRFFNADKGGYAEGDVFLGVSMPDIRKHIKLYAPWTEATVRTYLVSPYHEVRMAGFLILVDWLARAEAEPERRAAYELYREHLPYCNNWDIVDSSAPTLIGRYLLDKEPSERMQVLLPLATSGQLWEQRVAMVGTYGLIVSGQAGEALALAELLLPHKHDLMRKAVGWMLREVGKRVSRSLLIDFLDKHVCQMSSITLSYATEHLSPDERLYYRQKRKV